MTSPVASVGAGSERVGMQRLPSEAFDLRTTLNSGQVFHWEWEGNAACGLIGDVLVRVEASEDGIHVPSGEAALAAHYFALDHDLEAIYATFPNDCTAQSALAACRGLRIIRQPKWECIATFITSSMKQVAHIRQMSLALREAFGTPVPGSRVRAYPTPEALAGASEDALRACGLGYRARHLRRAATAVAEGGFDPDGSAGLPTEQLRRELCTLPGVGVKVANCILLFAYERLDAVPIDVWIGRILRETYLRRRKKITPRLMEAFASRYFGPHAGYVQQYLFHHARTRK